MNDDESLRTSSWNAQWLNQNHHLQLLQSSQSKSRQPPISSSVTPRNTDSKKLVGSNLKTWQELLDVLVTGASSLALLHYWRQ